MTIRLGDNAILLEGDCRVEEAERLTTLLQEKALPVDITGSRSLHAAVVQAILVFRAKIIGEPEQAFLRDLLKPALIASEVKTTTDLLG